jgi:hypothetical protein
LIPTIEKASLSIISVDIEYSPHEGQRLIQAFNIDTATFSSANTVELKVNNRKYENC